MKNVFISASRLLAASFLLTALSATSLAWSDSDRKPSVQNAVTKTAPDKKSDKGLADPEKDLKSGKKEGTSVKKSVVKKAGTAAAAGVATKKVTSTIKK